MGELLVIMKMTSWYQHHVIKKYQSENGHRPRGGTNKHFTHVDPPPGDQSVFSLSIRVGHRKSVNGGVLEGWWKGPWSAMHNKSNYGISFSLSIERVCVLCDVASFGSIAVGNHIIIHSCMPPAKPPSLVLEKLSITTIFYNSWRENA